MRISLPHNSTHKTIPLGTKIGRLTIDSPPFKKNQKRHDIYYACRCECGVVKEIRWFNLSITKHGRVNSCGCLQSETQKINGSLNNLRHGFKQRKNKHPLYNIWYGMIRRCYKPKHPAYKRYGARGITVCNEWLLDSAKFIKWGIASGWKPKLQLDRKDNSLGYSPANCRFITRKENCRNTRTNRYITIGGQTKSMVEWCEIYDRYYNTVNARINYYGMDPVEAVTKPTPRGFVGSS